jgi:hypothetical protein
MAFDEKLAVRFGAAMGRKKSVEQRKMFGATCAAEAHVHWSA